MTQFRSANDVNAEGGRGAAGEVKRGDASLDKATYGSFTSNAQSKYGSRGSRKPVDPMPSTEILFIDSTI